jgi:KUP system potassium uptake protein
MAALPKPKSPDSSRTDPSITARAALTALGIVSGDLGTSPLYTLQTIVQIVGGKVSATMMIGILSLIVWALILTISIKYCLFVMRADNDGEGGILIVMSFLGEKWSSRRHWLLIAGLFGDALIYGDGIITPSISVMSAVEGLNVATNFFKPHIAPIAVGILLALFAIRSYGTAKIGAFSGPVMLLWFITIAALGITSVAHQPRVLLSLNPQYGLALLADSGWLGFTVLGACSSRSRVGKHSMPIWGMSGATLFVLFGT